MAFRSPRLCVFDLDGTLVNSLRDIAEALNACLGLLGLPPRPVDDYRYMVGEGVPVLCRRAIGDTHPHLVGRLIELVRPRYRVSAVQHTRPYPGVPQMVERLQAAGMRLAVLSNKPHEMTRDVVWAFWADDVFERVQGYIEEEFRKPSPHYLLDICRTTGVPPADTCLIGDTPTDVATAAAAGTQSLAVTWGFRSRADLLAAGARRLIDAPEQASEALGLAG